MLVTAVGFVAYAGDTQSRNLYKNLVQVDLHKKLDHISPEWHAISQSHLSAYVIW